MKDNNYPTNKDVLERLAWECKQLTRCNSSAAEKFKTLKDEFDYLIMVNEKIAMKAEGLYRRLADEILNPEEKKD